MKRFFAIGLNVLLSLTVVSHAEFRIAIDETYLQFEPLIVSDFERLYENLGLKPKIEVMPGKRAMVLATSGTVDALDARFLGTDLLKDLIPIDVPIYASASTYAWSLDEDIRISSLTDLKNYRVTASSRSAINMDFSRSIDDQIIFVDGEERAIKMVEAGRADIVILSDFSINYSRSKSLGLSLKPVSPVLHSQWVYHHIHSRHKALAPRIETMIRSMQEEGYFWIRPTANN